MMIKFENVVRVAAGVVALLIVAPPSAVALEKRQPMAQMLKRPAADQKQHHLVLQVNSNEPAMMNLALNNATNVAQYYKDLGEKVTIEAVTFGPGLHMLRADPPPVKARIKAIAESTPAISFKACGNTQENMHKAENKEIPLIPEAKVVKSGVVRVMELQERGGPFSGPDAPGCIENLNPDVMMMKSAEYRA